MKILVACEESQRVCIAFREKGHEAYSCDIIECSGGHPEWHIRWDVTALLNGRCTFLTQDGRMHKIADRWDMIVAHPPCTFMSKAGARWMYPKAGEISLERLELAMEARDFFFAMLEADCEKICVENPRPLKVVDLPKPTQVVQPYEYGHPYSKATCLWLKNLEPLVPTNIWANTSRSFPLILGHSREEAAAAEAWLTMPKNEALLLRALPEQWQINGDRRVSE